LKHEGKFNFFLLIHLSPGSQYSYLKSVNKAVVMEWLRVVRSIKVGDTLWIVRIVFLFVLSWGCPEKLWPAIARALARVHLQLHGQSRDRIRRRWLMLNGYIEPRLCRLMPVANMTHSYVARMQGFREYRPDGWAATIQVVGAEHIETALARGRGAVLWVAPFVYSDLVTKKGLNEAGYRVTHLSRPEHNISNSYFGIHVLNPIWTHIENRYLFDRITIHNNTSAPALATLRERLQQNKIVSITVGNQAKKTTCVDLMSAKLRLATGPLYLTRTMKSVLLPVFTVMQSTGTFVVHVESPLMAGCEDPEAPYECIVQSYAQRLKYYLLQYPEQWNAAESFIESDSDSDKRLGECSKN
jgi:lauroyl/myristoyl acyltransferase